MQRYPYLETLLDVYVRDNDKFQAVLDMLFRDEIPPNRMFDDFQPVAEELLDYIDQVMKENNLHCDSILEKLDEHLTNSFSAYIIPDYIEDINIKINEVLNKYHIYNHYDMANYVFVYALFVSYCKDMELIEKRKRLDRSRTLALWRKYPEFSRLPEDILEYEIYPHLF